MTVTKWWETELADAYVLIVDIRTKSSAEDMTVTTLVTGGSGLITGGVGWWYQQSVDNRSTLSGNVLLRKDELS